MWFAILAFGASLRADVVTLSDLPGAEDPVILGVKEEATKEFSPASTFKMIIALAAFEQKIATPETQLLCVDGNQPPTPKPLKFQQAMYESSNDFFYQLILKLTDEQLLDMAKRCQFGTVKVDKDDKENKDKPLVADRKEWIHGGPIRVTPKQEHKFLRTLVQGKLPVDVTYQKYLMAVMEWPKVEPGINVYGKTGSWERTFWYVGLGVKSTGVRVVTVTLTGSGANRARAIQRFFEQLKRPLPDASAESAPQPGPAISTNPNPGDFKMQEKRLAPAQSVETNGPISEMLKR